VRGIFNIGTLAYFGTRYWAAARLRLIHLFLYAAALSKVILLVRS
jgi:hypothetical protein